MSVNVQEDTSVVFFWEGTFLMAVEFYLAFQVLVIVFSVMSGLVSLYFLANRETGVTLIGSVRQGLEWATMFVWIVTCLVMAHLTPAADPARAEAVAGLVVRPGTGVESSA
ncbi:unnamed protein product, partial [Choristocarpus tenellus]